ncbi:MAG: uroporphyrinogen-III C-methyltransferase [Alsobacter sp.]
MSGPRALLRSLPVFRPGTVWLVGAGPGDPGLLTLHAVHALQSADVIVYDALVDPEILELAGAGAELEFAGKRGGRPSPRQRDITDRLIALARQDRRVLRLKGGDPFVFGRGGEEALALVAEGIPFRVVPGVTAGLAGLAYAGIPATTRDTNHGVILATGHCAPGEPGLDWAAVARTGMPVVLYMAMSHLGEIAARLAQGGLPADTPVAVVTDATTPRQRVLVTTLAEAVADVAREGLGSPAIIAIGSIVRLREALAPLSVVLEAAQ